MCVCVFVCLANEKRLWKKTIIKLFFSGLLTIRARNRCDVCIVYVDRVLWIMWLMIDSYAAAPHKMYVCLFACIQKGNRAPFLLWGPKCKRFYLPKPHFMHGGQSRAKYGICGVDYAKIIANLYAYISRYPTLESHSSPFYIGLLAVDLVFGEKRMIMRLNSKK